MKRAWDLDPEVRRAIEHPVRRKVLLVLDENNEPLGAADFIQYHCKDLALSRAGFHFRILVNCRLLQLVDSVPLEGGGQKDLYQLGEAFTDRVRRKVQRAG